MIKKINLKSDFLKYVVVLMSGTLAAQLINLGLSVPLFRYFYTPEEAAEWGLFLRIIGVGGALATARYEFAMPVTKIDVHAFRLYRFALSTALKVTLISVIAAIIPILLSDNSPDLIFYALIPAGLLLAAYYSIGTNWAIRTKTFRSISLSKVANSSVGGGFKLLFGWMGTGYIGLIIGTIIGLIAANTWFLLDFFKAKKKYRITAKSLRNKVLAKQYIEFPKVNLPHTIMDLGRDLLVAILILEIFTKADFGFFDQSYRILRLPLMLAGLAISQVFFQRCAEMFSKGQDIYPLILKSVKLLTLISIVPFTLIFFYGDEMFAFVFGERWRQAGEYSEIMAPWFMMNFIASPISFLPLVLNKQRQFFLMATGGALLMILSLTLPSYFYQADVTVTLWAMSLSQVAYFVFVIFKIFQYVKQSRPAK
ncbi:MAG: teichuronic acid exporter [Flavobacteriaceae bacterium]|jgi:teichuronic acid exporter